MKRKPLGKPLPPASEFPAPTIEEQDRISSLWDSLMPEKWRGMLDAKPLGSETPARFYYDEVKRQLQRANGGVVTVAERRDAYLAFQEALRK